MTRRMHLRLGRRPGEVIDRSRGLTFFWEGREYPAFEGDTIASALAACGVRTFSRSFKAHRRRGLMTASYADPGCIVEADGEPNVRGAHRRVYEGMEVRASNVWPSLAFDLRAAAGLFERFLPAGFYYKTFMRPRRMWPLYERVLRAAAGGGRMMPRAGGHYERRHAHPEVLVAGGGPAGISAAVAAAAEGARVMLVEEEPELGGHLRYGSQRELALLERLRAALQREDSIEVLTDASVVGRYDFNLVAVVQRLEQGGEALIRAYPSVLVVAPGLIERPYVFEGNDLPGVMLSTAVRRLINLYAVKPGERAVVLTANPEGDAATEDLRSAGVEVVHVEDVRRGGNIVRALGRGGVSGVECSGGVRVGCDLLVTATGWTAPTALLNMAGDRPRYDPTTARFLPSDLPEDVLATGRIMGDGTAKELIEHARATGIKAARHALGKGDGVGIPRLPLHEHPELFRGATHGVVDFSEDVSSRDILSAAGEGYDSAELMKRYTTAAMGPLQGKLEMVNAVAALAEATGRSLQETGTTVWRPPCVPVTLGALAAGAREPVRRSPVHPWHERHGARWMATGEWMRPDHYGDPQGEAKNVRENVGLIDVTPLGKLDLRGPDVSKLLNVLYLNRWDDVEVGRVRYGVMCSEDGVVFDDGVTARLGAKHYMMTTTSAGAGRVWEWVERWLQVHRPQWRVRVARLTDAYASINVAGPGSQRLLRRVTEGLDLSSGAFPYMAVRVAKVAGVEGCIVLRIGFTGELSYEVHAPAAYGLHLWETLIKAGEGLGIRPFGMEAQRILRLEKGHLIVGQDTDALTGAHAAGLGRMVKKEKTDFVGRPEVIWEGGHGDHLRLVALQPEDGAIVLPEGTQIVEKGGICGRITSSRYSPNLRRAVCLGLVAAHLAVPGARLRASVPDGGEAYLRVMEGLVHLDPEGVRLRD